MFDPPSGCTQDAAEYEMVLRLIFDNKAWFEWGTNWVYLLVSKGAGEG